MDHEFDIDMLLNELRKQDGKLWLRITGQTHWQYNEIPLWVLVGSRTQIRAALSFLQEKLRPIKLDPGVKFTLAFISFGEGHQYSHGMFEGEEIFFTDAYDNLYPEPFARDREAGVFDYEYPDDEWSIKDTKR